MSCDFVTICRSECEHFVEAYEPMIVALLGKTVQDLFFALNVLGTAVLGLVKELTAGKKVTAKRTQYLKLLLLEIFKKSFILLKEHNI